jgi:hypothetical protein
MEIPTVSTEGERRVPAPTDILITCRGGARYLAILAQNSKFFKILRIEMKNYPIIIRMEMY